MKAKYYKKKILILTAVFFTLFVFNYISFKTGYATMNLNALTYLNPEILVLLKSLIIALLGTGIVHAGLFIYNFTKYRTGQSGCLIGVLCFFLLWFIIVVSVVTLIPYYIYCIIKYIKLKKRYVQNNDDSFDDAPYDIAAIFFRNFKEDRKSEAAPYIQKYKQTIRLFQVLIIIVVVATLFISAFIDINVFWLIPLFAIGLFFLMVKRKFRIIAEIEKLIMVNCDPEIAAWIFHEIEIIEHSIFFNRLFVILKCNAFTMLDMTPEAKSRLFAINIIKADRLSKITYYNAVASCCMALDDLYNVRQIKQQLELMQTDNKNNKYKKTILFGLQKIEAYLYTNQGDFAKGREFYEILLQNPSPCAKVLFTLSLAKIDIAEGKSDNARQKLEYVVQNGNKMAAVKTAQDELSKMN